MRPARKQPKVRLNLDMTVEVKEQIEALRDRTHADSMSEVIRRALAVYDFLLTETAEGSDTIIRTRDGSEKHIALI
ncbi:ribbon-helix-helix protein, CopG family [Ralstonia pseudosolanacearum]|uniref:ribbon-helix-helix protein, CopG family n=1 Tax=Ralstonia pseudosolanacearum TaxID=1310165 RepID=UPI001FFBA452|nr:ribbon-helix-helix protein, CopG family [Ralstonia pseudosolanacearum]